MKKRPLLWISKGKRDMSDKRLAQSADRCSQCPGVHRKEACEAIRAQGGCKVAASKGPNTAAADALMGIFKGMGVNVVDVAPCPARVTFTVDGVPVGKGRPRFTRTGHCYTPAKTVGYENLVKLAYAASRMGYRRDTTPYTGSVLLSIRAYFPIPKSWPKAKREAARLETVQYQGKPDWDNIGKIVSDALNGLAWKDDSQVDGMVTRRYSPTPRIEVRIESRE